MIWVDVCSDAIIAITYFAIPFELLYFLKFYPIPIPKSNLITGILFSFFTILCGCTHLLNVIHAIMDISTSHTMTIFKILCSILSVLTFIGLLFVVPNILKFCIYTQQLEHDIQHRIKELDQAHEQTKQINQRMGEFMAFLCHEIRNPLHAICANTDFLYETKLSLEQKECIKNLDTSAKLMSNIVNDVLDISRLQAGGMSFEHISVDLYSLCSSLISELTPRARAKTLSLEFTYHFDTPRYIFSDPTRIHQILLNLITNAIKFTSHGSVSLSVRKTSPPVSSGNTSSSSPYSNELLSIEVNNMNDNSEHNPNNSNSNNNDKPLVNLPPTGITPPFKDRTLSPTKDTWIEFEVTDTGTGISPESVPKLFSPYTQAKLSTVRLHGGTGLGLAICRQIVNYMQGYIKVKSEIGIGSSFLISLPFDIDFDNTSSSSFNTISEKIIGGHPDLIEDKKTEEGNTEIIPLLKKFSLRTSSSLEHDEVQENSSSLLGSVSSSPVINHANKLRILVVDDSLINRGILTKMLTSLGYEVLVACDGMEASNLVISQNASYFSCIFMDISMPNMDGYEATRIIRSKGITTPIIALTANSLSEEKTKAEKAGMDCFCTKPLRRDKIIKLLETLTSSKKIIEPELTPQQIFSSNSSYPAMVSSAVDKHSESESSRSSTSSLSITSPAHPLPVGKNINESL